MKILVISTNYLPQVGGVEIVVHETISRLARKNKVVLVTQGWSSLESQENLAVFRTYLGFLGKSFRSSLAFPLLFPLSLCRLICLCRRQKFDLIHLHFLDWAGLYAILLKHIFRIPLITSCHGSDVYIFPRKNSLHNKLFQFVIKNSNHVCGTSQHLIKQITQHYSSSPPPVSVVPNGIDQNLFKSQNKESKPSAKYILFTGRLAKIKGIETLIRAFHQINPQQKHLNLRIAGHGPERRNLEELVSELSLTDWVQFLGSVDHKDLPKVYTNALFTVVPSIQESFGMVAIESLACGTPVIASDAGGLPEIVTANCGLIFPAGNINTLAKNMKKLLEDDKLRDRLTKGAIEQARQFSWEKTVEKLEKVYLQHQ